MKNFKTILFILALATIAMASCKKDPKKEPEPVNPGPGIATTGTVSINFSNVVGDSTLVFHTKNYVTANNDTIKVSVFKYYISNIKLLNNDGSVYTEANSYHLVDAANASTCIFSLANVPYGKYTGISFMIGVDSARNVSGAQTGALDPVHGMFWNWSTGYMMARLEGTSPQSTNANLISYEIIGFRGTYNVLKTVSLSFNTDTASVSSAVSPGIYLKTDIAEWFKTPVTINIATLNTVNAIGPEGKTMADNYEDMISIESISN